MASNGKTIALFGATGNTGKHFLKAALDQGYTVKALVRNPDKVPVVDDRLTKVLQSSGRDIA